MRTAIRLSAFAAIVSMVALAETWSGKLVDASCADPQKTEACVPSASTTAFALAASGKVMKLDATGNTKAAEALKAKENSANRSKSEKGEIMATVKGAINEDTIQVESIEVR